jgi:hypothetical protein
MASGITHILLMKNLQTIMPESKLKHILASGRDFLQVGAVGPDLPYASIADSDLFFSTQSNMADNFHYVKTNQVSIKAFEEIKANKDSYSAKELRYIFDFFLGFISHIVADGIIHPFIRDKVGNYHEHQSEHRVLEMQLDVLLFHYLTKYSGKPIELNYSNIHDEIGNLYTGFYPESDKVIDLLSVKINEVYAVKYNRELIYDWIGGLHRMWGAAEGDHPAIYKEISFIKTFLFSNYDELLSKYDDILTLRVPVDRSINFLHKDKVHFFNDCIPRFNNIFIPLAKKGYRYIYENGEPITDLDIYPIDLDTGRDLAKNNNLDLIPSYWS